MCNEHERPQKKKKLNYPGPPLGVRLSAATLVLPSFSFPLEKKKKCFPVGRFGCAAVAPGGPEYADCYIIV